MAPNTARLLDGKCAFVTGGSGGIGRALCVRFASLGATVAFSYFSDHEAADETSRLVQEAGGPGAKAPATFRGNLADAADCKRIGEEVLAAMPAVDVFVSNAASGVLKPVTELTAKHWDWTIGVNARSFLILANALAPTMPPGGRILALSSMGATRAIPLYGVIGASKAALEATVRALALELGAKGITVNAISPGVVETGALEHFPNKEELLAISKMRTPVGRIATPEDVADVAELLCSPKAKMIHGQTISVDGGFNIIA